MLLFLLVVAVAQGKTVRYSNVPPRAAIATKTYDLEVPGSAPIRIIEAEPIWNPEVVTTLTSRDFEHRGTKPTKHKSGKDLVTTTPQTVISETVTQDPGPLNSNSYSAEALNSFLKEYAQKVKEGRKKFDVNNEHTTEEPINKLASIYLENERMDDDDKSKSWGLMDIKRHKHPYDDKKGWVTLEAVPWSTSKISKWQSNNKNEPKPWENQRPQIISNWSNKHSNNPHKNTFIDTNDNYHGSSSTLNVNTYNNNNYNDNDYNNGYEDQFNSNDNIFNDKPIATYDADIRPQDYPLRPNIPQYSNSKPDYPPYTNPRPDFPPYNSKPSYGTDVRPIKIKPDPSDWPVEIPQKPSWHLRPISQSNHGQNIPQNHPQNSPVPDPWLDRNPSPMFMYGSPGYKDEHKDIITDGRPNDFPKVLQNPLQGYEPIQERPTVISHPPTHPINGNGEWVLVSTTKGYQYPRSKHQRSIEVTPDSVGTRRGIRLTVLPPDSDTNINMTTSHGGILEVESTFETVEESHNKHVASAENIHVQPNRTRFTQKKKPVRHQLVFNRKPKPGQQKRPYGAVKQNHAAGNTQDATAVLAAVGAGMVPATMAMLVPFVSGRRRRNVDNIFQKKVNASKVPVNFFNYMQS